MLQQKLAFIGLKNTKKVFLKKYFMLYFVENVICKSKKHWKKV